MVQLFDPLVLRGTVIDNRAWLAPMCQYMVEACDGVPTDWHLVHLGSRAVGGFGLVLTEAAAVTPQGRISAQDTGLWDDGQTRAWARIVDFVHARDTLIGVQLAHAGRKASVWRPFGSGGGHGYRPPAEGGWQPVGPADRPFPGLAVPSGLSQDQIGEIIQQFAAAAQRADRAGFDVAEIHAAHGYLLHQFLSPLSNTRADEYGGGFGGRTRIVFEVVDAVRAVWPDHKPLFIRLSATDWLPGGWDIAQTSELARRLRPHGIDLADISSGGLLPSPDITIGPGYQAGFAREVRATSGVPTAAVGLICHPEQAQAHLSDGDADAILFGRAAIREPYLPIKAAKKLDITDWQGLLPDPYRAASETAN